MEKREWKRKGRGKDEKEGNPREDYKEKGKSWERQKGIEEGGRRMEKRGARMGK